MCKNAQAQGIDFPNANAHSGQALPMRTFEAAYIGEKLGCIFGPSLQDPDNRKAFLEKAELQDFSKSPLLKDEGFPNGEGALSSLG